MKKIILYVLFGLLIDFQEINAQVVDFKEGNYWVSFGGGVAKASGAELGFCDRLGFNYSKGNQVLKARILFVNDRFDIFGDEYNKNAFNFGVLVGKLKSKKFFQTASLIGVGFVMGTKKGEYIRNIKEYVSEEFEKDSFYTLSIPVEVEFIFKPSKFIGIGLGAFVDLNIVRPAFGVSANISIGKLR